VNDRSGGFRGRSNLALYNIQDKTLQQITFGKTNLSVNDISFDSQKILVMASNETITERPFRNHTLLEIDLQTLHVDTLAQDKYLQRAAYSPDAKEILITAQPDAFDGIGLNIAEGQTANLYDSQCFILNKATKEVEPVTKNFDPSIQGAEWSSYNKNIYFLAEEKDFSHVYEYNPFTKKYTLI
jgi:dipeptidyl aminopeptidase/acylaminoacyl peptidase